MKTGIIYKVTNLLNKKSYIGQTIKSIDKRKYFHIRTALNKKSKIYKCKFYNALRKYGFENFKWEILEENIPVEFLHMKECEWILGLNTFRSGYNSTIGGISPMLGKKHTEESKLKKSISSKGHEAWNKGKKHTEETKLKMKINRKPRKWTEEERQRASVRMKNSNPMKNKDVAAKVSKARIDKEIARGENHPMFGKHFSNESKEKMSKSHKSLIKLRDSTGRFAPSNSNNK